MKFQEPSWELSTWSQLTARQRGGEYVILGDHQQSQRLCPSAIVDGHKAKVWTLSMTASQGGGLASPIQLLGLSTTTGLPLRSLDPGRVRRGLTLETAPSGPPLLATPLLEQVYRMSQPACVRSCKIPKALPSRVVPSSPWPFLSQRVKSTATPTGPL